MLVQPQTVANATSVKEGRVTIHMATAMQGSPPDPKTITEPIFALMTLTSVVQSSVFTDNV